MVADFKKNENAQFFNKKLFLKSAGVLFIGIIIILFFVDYKIFQKKQELIAQIAEYENQIREIKKNNQNLKNEIDNADNKDYLEKIAYEQLGRQKPGEKEIIFIAPPKKTQEAPKQQENLQGWFLKTWSWIKSKF